MMNLLQMYMSCDVYIERERVIKDSKSAHLYRVKLTVIIQFCLLQVFGVNWSN